MYPFKYYVCAYDEIEEHNYEKFGLLYASGYVNATEKLVNYYGETNIVGFQLKGLKMVRLSWKRICLIGYLTRD